MKTFFLLVTLVAESAFAEPMDYRCENLTKMRLQDDRANGEELIPEHYVIGEVSHISEFDTIETFVYVVFENRQTKNFRFRMDGQCKNFKDIMTYGARGFMRKVQD